MGHFVLNVPVSHEMSPLAKILVFYVTDDGEMVADSIHVPIQQCLENKVHLLYLYFEKILKVHSLYLYFKKILKTITRQFQLGTPLSVIIMPIGKSTYQMSNL